LLNEVGSVKSSSGAYGRPDIIWQFDKYLFGVEVKSVRFIRTIIQSNGKYSYSISAIRIVKDSWTKMTEYCKENGIIPIMIAEYRTKSTKGYLYLVIPGNEITNAISSTKKEIYYLTFMNAIRIGIDFDRFIKHFELLKKMFWYNELKVIQNILS